jgi:hypothetical protein
LHSKPLSKKKGRKKENRKEKKVCECHIV